MSARVSIGVAGAVERQALDRAVMADPKLTPLEWRVLAAVIALTVSYCRLVDRLYVAQVAAFAFGFGFDRLPEDPTKRARDWRIVETGRALKRLRDRGILIYQPARGRGRPSLIGFPEPPEKARAGAPLSGKEKARAPTPLSSDKWRGIQRVKGASSFSRPTEELPRRKQGASANAAPNPEEQGARFDRVVSHNCDRCDNGWIDKGNSEGMTKCPAWT